VEDIMDLVYARCCGIDVHQASLAVCVSIKEQGRSEKYKLRCGTTTAELLRLSDWLHEHGVTHVAMEATGVYWKPVWHVLEGQFELLLANPTQVKALRGRKTDLKDGERIADFLQHGLLQGSFVPPAAIQQLRDLTRNRDSAQAGTGPDREAHSQSAGRRQHQAGQRDVGCDGGFRQRDAASHQPGATGRSTVGRNGAGQSAREDSVAERGGQGEAERASLFSD
jgi:hypothetical protein